MHVEGLVDPEVLEAAACSEELSLAADLNLHRVHVVTDCLATVTHLRNTFRGPSAMIIDEIKAKLVSLREVKIEHEGREGNHGADKLAKAVTTLPVDRHVWILNTPDITCIDDVLDFY